MYEKFQNKYRIPSHRKNNWDYSADAFYFLTIVTQYRACILGEIVKSNEEFFVKLSDFGKIVEQEWFKSFDIRTELILHDFVIMPNHIHAVVEICNENPRHTNDCIANNLMTIEGNNTSMVCTADSVETHGRASLPNHNELLFIKRNMPKRLPRSISSFVAGFKSAVNTQVNNYIDQHHLDILKYDRYHHFFQPNYHDHIIQNHQEYLRIRYYIIHNPKNWDEDSLHP